MRKLYPDVSQLVKKNSQSEIEKQELEQVISAFSAIPQAQASSEFQQRLRANLLEQAHRQKPGRVISFFRKIKPHYLSIGAVATIFLAITAVAGPYYLELGKVDETGKSQSSRAKAESTSSARPEEATEKPIILEAPMVSQPKAENSAAALQDATASDIALKADMPQRAAKKAKGTVAIQSLQDKGLSAEPNPALQIKYELQVPFPKAPKELGVYQHSSAPFTNINAEISAAEAQDILGAVYKYPIISPAEAWEQLKIEPRNGSAPNTVVFINNFKLVYHNFVQTNQEVNQNSLQPAYYFSGLDNWGNSFELFLPAIKSEYFHQD